MLKDLWKLIKDTAIYGFGKAILLPLGLVTLPLFTRVFNPSEYGVIELIMTISAFMVLFLALGMESAAVRSFFDSSSDEYKKQVISSGFWLLVIWNLVVLMAMAIYSGQISALAFKTGRYSAVLLLAFINVPLSILVAYAQNTMRLHFAPWKFTLVAFLNGIFTIGLSILLVLQFKMGILGYFGGILAGSVISLAPALYFIKKDLAFAFSFKKTKEMLSFGAPLIPAALAYYMIAMSDRFFLSKFATLGDVGLYGIAVRVQSIMLFFYTAFGMAWSPFFFKIYSDSEERVKELTCRVFKYLLLFLFLLAVFLTTFSQEILRLLTTEQYYGAAIAIGPLCLGSVAYASSQMAVIGMSVKRKTIYVALLTWVAAAVNLLLNFLLVPRWGILGASISNALSYIVLTVVYLIVSQRLYPLAYDKTALLKICFLGFVFIAVGGFIRLDGLLLSLAVKSAFMLLFVFMLFVFRVFDSTEVGYVRQLSGRLAGKK